MTDETHLNKVRKLNPDFEIRLHELDVNVGGGREYMYYICVTHKEANIRVYTDRDFNEQEVINRLPSKFTLEKEYNMLPKGVQVRICDYSNNSGIYIFSEADYYLMNHTVNVTISYPLKNPYTFTAKCDTTSSLINQIVLAYKKIYEEEKENPGKYGIWGHYIENLWLEKITLDVETGNIKLSVGS